MKGFVYRIGYSVVKAWWFFRRPVTRGVKCLLVHDGKVLGIRHTYGNPWWTFPGGGVKRGESTEAAVRREAREELGLGIVNLQVLGKFFTNREYKRDTVMCFVGEPDQLALKLREAEIAEAQWFSLDAFPPYRAPIAEFILKQYGKMHQDK